MGLFKKKDADTDIQQPEKTPKPAATKNKQKSGLIGLVTLLTGFILVAIVISTGVQFFNASQANQRHLIETQNALGQTYLNQLNANLTNIQQSTEQTAAQESLFLLLRVQDKALKQRTEQQITATLPFAKKTRIIPVGQAQLDTQSEMPLTFAGLDMVKRLEKGQSVPLEFHRLNNTYYLQSIAPIKNDQGRMVASLLVTYETVAIFGAFFEMDTSLGELLIEQTFSNNAPTMLFAQGEGNKDKLAFSKASNVPHLTLTYKISSTQINQPLINQNQTFIAGLIAILLVLVGMAMFHYVMNSRLNKNMHLLSEFTLSIGSGRKPKIPDFTLGQFTTFAQALFQQTRRSNSSLEESIIPDAFSNSTPEHYEESNDLHLDLDLDEESMELEEAEEGAISQQIFRAYDIRGRVSDQLTPEAVELIGQAIGSEAYERGQQTIYVGHDGRLSSPDLANALIHGLKSTGRDVIDIGQVATPVVYFAAYTQDSNSGIMITGSHNPPEYNGIKVVIDGEPLHEDGIHRLYNRIVENDLLSGEGTYHKINLDQEYMDRVISDIAVAQPLTVVIDAGNGVAGQYAPKLFEAIGCDVIPLYCDVDGNFPNHHPDPTIESNLSDLIATVQGKHADLGIAFDGDGDRIVVVDNEGHIIQPDQLMMLFAKDVLSRCPGTDIVYDVKCSNKLGAYISQHGGRPVAWKSGHSLIKTKMLELGATFGGEMSGHLVFNERWYGFDDGLYAAARLLELLSTDNRPVNEVFKDYPLGLITPEYHIETSEHAKFEIVARLKDLLSSPAATLTEIDGVRVDYDNGWGIVRASNTTPSLTLRFEGDDQDTLSMIMDQFKDAITQVDPALQIPF
ncbi:hypothetical protein ACFOEK_16235 [Litoribrevibacter euphylliae]|uniref:phosphomannomutase n=1 Tax=Litoribrevibacter euphylliae TaxID=1834034 RepID=A0ABV7HIS3_9GAMM